MNQVQLLTFGMLITIGVDFQTGYHAGMLNAAVVSFQQTLNDSRNGTLTDTEFSWIWGLIESVGTVGSLVILFVAPLIAERVGRKGGFFVSELFSIVGTVIACTYNANSYPEVSIVVANFVIGIHSGLNITLQSLYFMESSPTNLRGILGSAQELAMTFSSIVGAILGLQEVLGTNMRMLFIAGAVPPALACIALLFWPESPKHLLLHVGDEGGARKSIEFFHGKAADVQHVIDTIEMERCSPAAKASNTPWTFELKYGVFVGVLAAVAQVCCGCLPISVYSTLILVHSGLSVDIAQKAAVGMMFASFAGNVLGMFVVERFPRRTLLIGTLVISTLAGVYYVGVGAAPEAPYWLRCSIIGALLICTFVPMLGVSTISWFLVSELVMHEKRSVAQSIDIGVLSVVLAGVVFIFPPLLHTVGSSSYLLLCSVPSALVAVLLFLYMPETRRREVPEVVDDIQARQNTFLWLGVKSSKQGATDLSPLLGRSHG